jgi:uncharacterized membrane protein
MIDEVVEHHAYSLPQIMEIRNAVYPVAVHLCRLFGFQMEHTHAGEAVPSSMDNQVDHVSSLLKNTMDRNKGDNKGYRTAIQQAVGVLHQQTFSNYTRWAETLGLREQGAASAKIMGDNDKFEKKSSSSQATVGSLTANSWDSTGLFQFSSAEEEQRWLCHAQLHQLVLWYLIWGEAANLRHAPELLCFLFHLTANAIRLPQTTPPTSTDGTRKYVFRGSMLPMPPMDFLDSIVTPIYAFLRTEISERQNDAIGTRTMYDDVNETFWLQDRLALILPKELWKVAGSGSLHGTLAEKDIRAGFAFVRDLFKPAKKVVTKKGEAARELSRFFGKTYCEMTTWLNVFHIYYRVYMWHLLLMHLTFVLAFTGKDATGSDVTGENGTEEWVVNLTNLATVCITHALCKIVRQITDIIVGHPPRDATSHTVDLPPKEEVADAYDGLRLSTHMREIEEAKKPPFPIYLASNYKVDTSHVILLALYASVPAVCAIEASARMGSGEELIVFQFYALIYACIHGASLFASTRPGRSLRSFLRKEHKPYVGGEDQLAVPLHAYFTYSLFWLITLGAKGLWGYYMIILPLVKPIAAIWKFEDQCWSGNPTTPTVYCPPRLQGTTEIPADVIVRKVVLSVLLILIRCLVPFLVYFFDTYIWYTVVSSAFSVVMATYQRIGRVSTWSQLVRTIESSVALFNEKMINVDDEDDENADDADATEEFPSHRKMARRGGGYSYTSLLGPGSGGLPRILGKLFSKASSSDARRGRPSAPTTSPSSRGRGSGSSSGVRGTRSAARCARAT